MLTGRPRPLTSRLLVPLAAAVALALVPAAAAVAAPDHTATLQPGQSFSWRASSPAGTNLNYFGYLNQRTGQSLPTGVCAKTPDTYCDQILVALENPLTPDDVEREVTERRRLATVSLNGFTGPGQTADFDMAVYASDASGARGQKLAETTWETNPPTITLQAVTTAQQPVRHVLVEVVYWIGVGGYTGSVRF